MVEGLEAVADVLARYQVAALASYSGYHSEWLIIGLAKGGYLTSSQRLTYLDALSSHLRPILATNVNKIDKTSSTDNSRVILALTALGIDASGFAGSDLTAPLADLNYVTAQGINGAIFALLALDSGAYGSQATRDALINYILSRELITSGGGWALQGNTANADVTSMALYALARYYNTGNIGLDAIVVRAVDKLAQPYLQDPVTAAFGTTMEDASGIFKANCESTSQVIIALAALGIPINDDRFVKSIHDLDPVDALLSFYDTSTGGFKHLLDGSANSMASEQAMLALQAEMAVLKGEAPLFSSRSGLQDAAWPRLEGANRYDSMEAIARSGWTQADTAIVVAADGSGKTGKFPDGLAASSLAGLYDAPIILTDTSTTLSAQAARLITDLQVKDIVIIGSEASVSAQTAEQIDSLISGNVTRIAGSNRYDTATSLYNSHQGSWGTTAVIADGRNFPDALSISSFAFVEKAPILLSSEAGLSQDAVALIARDIGARKITKVILCGGVNSVPDQVITQIVEALHSPGHAIEAINYFTRLAGANRYETSTIIANYAVANSAALSYHNISIAMGENFPDALTSGAFAGKIGSVVLLAHDTADGGRYGLENLVRTRRSDIGSGYALGGTASVSANLMTDFWQAALG